MGLGQDGTSVGLSVKSELLSEWDLALENTLFLSEEDVSHCGVGMAGIFWITEGFGIPVEI